MKKKGLTLAFLVNNIWLLFFNYTALIVTKRSI